MFRLDKEKIKNKYYNIGDLAWLEEIEEQIKEQKEVKEYGHTMELLACLYKINCVLIETETNEYMSKFNGEILEIYIKMKQELIELIDFEEMWEE